MKKVILLAVVINFLTTSSNTAFASERDESGAVLCGIICAVLGCNPPTHSDNRSSDSESDDSTPMPAPAPEPIQTRDHNQLGRLLVENLSSFAPYMHINDFETLSYIPSQTVYKMLNEKGSNTFNWVGMGHIQTAYGDGYKINGKFSVLKMGSDKNGKSFCIEFRNYMLATPYRDITRPNHVYDRTVIACDDFSWTGGLKETQSKTIQWSKIY